MSCIGHDITLVSQPGQIVLTDHPELYMNLKNDFLWQMPWRHVLFLCPRRGLRRGQAPLRAVGSGTFASEMGSGTLPDTGSGTSACGGVRHFARDGVRHLCLRRGQAPCQRRGQAPMPRWGQAPLPEMGSDPIGDCDISALALYSVLFYNSWCWWQHKYSIRW